MADMDDFVLIKLTGDAVDIMCKANNKYEIFVAVESGKRVLYLRLLKALYGCVKSALLWYELFTSTLQEMGFELNPYDPCVANKMINGKQCTIGWYVDDNKISHVDPDVVTSIIEKIEEKFGKMTVTRGKVHTFLGMKITLQKDKTVMIVEMKEYIKDAIEDFAQDVSKHVATPAKKDLFEIDEKSPKLDKDEADHFHRIVVKLLYVSKRGRVDIQLAIAFLCTRVSCCSYQDWDKLKRVMQFLNRTLDDYMIIGADCLTVLKTWVDASYGVHPDMKSHTGGVVSLGRGVIMSKSSKQKLNTKSSTEAELVGASDYLPSTIWAKMFLEEQGYKLRENAFYQDNQSAMKLETNGRASCGQKSRHIDIRYFFMKDRVKNENIKIVYCPTEQMLADFFTKPLQGSLFEKFRKVLMGHAHIDTLSSVSLLPTEERVAGTDGVSHNHFVDVQGQTSTTFKAAVGEENETEQTAAGKNEQGNQDTSVSDDVTTKPESDWTVVAGRTRAYKKVLPTTHVRFVPTAGESMSKMKTKRKDESRAHSFV